MIKQLWRTIWRPLKKLGIKLLYDPKIPLQGKTLTEKDTCIPMFIAVLYTVARTWTQPRCPLTDEWIKTCGTYILSGILLSHKKGICL